MYWERCFNFFCSGNFTQKENERNLSLSPFLMIYFHRKQLFSVYPIFFFPSLSVVIIPSKSWNNC